MRIKLLTHEAQYGGARRTVDPKDWMKYFHDALHLSAREKLDTSIILGTLSDDGLCRPYREATGEPFAESLRNILVSGGTIRLLIWSKLSEELIPQSIRDLLKTKPRPWSKNALRIQVSGTKKGWEVVPNMAIGKTKKGVHRVFWLRHRVEDRASFFEYPTNLSTNSSVKAVRIFKEIFAIPKKPYRFT